MTRPDADGQAGPWRAEVESSLREAMHRTTADVLPSPQLAERVGRIVARRQRRRHRAAVAGVAAAVLAVGALAGGLADRLGTHRTVPGGQPATATLPAPGPSAPAPAPDSWGTPTIDEHFTEAALDPARWIEYTGPAGDPQTMWSPAEVAMSGGALHLSVRRVSDAAPQTLAGGVKSAIAARYGRWEVRWRMTAGNGVTGQFLFLGEGPGGVGHVALLSSAERTLTISDPVHDVSHTVSVDGTGYHTLAVELTPRSVRWLMDGTVLTVEPGAAPRHPVVAALQAMMSGPDCGARPMPRGCAGPTRFPQRLDVDWVRFWPYRGA